MHPHYNPWHHSRMGFACYRGPSRIFWFIVGAGATAWWFKHKEMQNPTWGHCRRPAIQNAPMTPPPGGASGSSGSPYPGTDTPANADSSFSFKDIPRRINNIAPSDASWNWGWSERKEDQDRLAEMRKNATEAMSDMTEATLESILSAAEVLRARLAENRAQRAKQEELAGRQAEEQSRNPPQPL